MRAAARIVAFGTWLVLTAVVQAQILKGPVTLVVPPEGSVTWRGIGAEEAAGAQGMNMLYPAPNLGGLLGAILTHAVIVQSRRESERNARQATADKVLEPHAGPIADMTPVRLLEAVLARMTSAGDVRLASTVNDVVQGVIVEMRPSFALAPDRRTVVLDNAIKVQDVGSTVTTHFENFVRVVATPREDADPTAYWTADDGRALKDESAAMLAHSVDVALNVSASGTDPAPFRTQRYRFGSQEKMERGQPVGFTCARVVLRTLREWLMSVPVSTPEGAAPCPNPYRMDVR